MTKLEERIDRSVAHLERALAARLRARARLLVVALIAPLALAAALPLWRLDMSAPQYPDGLTLRIYAYTVEGDVNEVNTLNHYIGMRPIDRASLSDLDWIPFAIGVAALLLLRVAAIGDMRALVDALALFAYFGLFAFARFAYALYVFGHNLDPHAPFHVEPFTPVVLGTADVANFTIRSLPAAGSVALLAVGLGLVTVLWLGIRSPSFTREERS
jgi:hypothetical protein